MEIVKWKVALTATVTATAKISPWFQRGSTELTQTEDTRLPRCRYAVDKGDISVEKFRIFVIFNL